MTPILQVDRLSAWYGKIQAVRDISITVEEREVVTLIGSNGAGKTTFARSLVGVHPGTAGTIVFDGDDISRWKSAARMRRGLMLIPEGRSVLSNMTVRENLMIGMFASRERRTGVAARVDEVYDRFPILRERSSLLAGTLSGGQQQMLAIGQALMARPKLLLLDEPSLGLAPLMVAEVFSIIRSLADEGMTILLIEQNAKMALSLAKRAYVFSVGEVVLSGPSEDVMKDDAVRAAYLGQGNEREERGDG